MLTTESRSRRWAESSAFASAMRNHPTGSELQFSACRALAKLARHADNLIRRIRGRACARGVDDSYKRLGSLRSYAESSVGTLPQQTGFTRRRGPPRRTTGRTRRQLQPFGDHWTGGHWRTFTASRRSFTDPMSLKKQRMQCRRENTYCVSIAARWNRWREFVGSEFIQHHKRVTAKVH
jgi:hypothetical protein